MMERYIFVENGVLNGAGEALLLDEGVTCVSVSDDVYKSYLAEPFRYIFVNGEIKENPDYELERQRIAIKNRIIEIYEQLDDIDKKRIRAVCENSVKDTKSGESWLDYYNNIAIELRNELNDLESQIG